MNSRNSNSKLLPRQFWQPVSSFHMRLCQRDPTPPAKKHAATKKAKTPPPTHGRRADSVAAPGVGKPDRQPEERPGRQGCAVEAGAAGGCRRAGRSGTRRKRRLHPAAGVGDNAAAVTTLQTTVTDLKSGNSGSPWPPRSPTRRPRSRRIDRQPQHTALQGHQPHTRRLRGG
jgi:hypothetical protein